MGETTYKAGVVLQSDYRGMHEFVGFIEILGLTILCNANDGHYHPTCDLAWDCIKSLLIKQEGWRGEER